MWNKKQKTQSKYHLSILLNSVFTRRKRIKTENKLKRTKGVLYKKELRQKVYKSTEGSIILYRELYQKDNKEKLTQQKIKENSILHLQKRKEQEGGIYRTEGGGITGGEG